MSDPTAPSERPVAKLIVAALVATIITGMVLFAVLVKLGVPIEAAMAEIGLAQTALGAVGTFLVSSKWTAADPAPSTGAATGPPPDVPPVDVPGVTTTGFFGGQP